jgi:hypothetical protein
VIDQSTTAALGFLGIADDQILIHAAAGISDNWRPVDAELPSGADQPPSTRPADVVVERGASGWTITPARS